MENLQEASAIERGATSFRHRLTRALRLNEWREWRIKSANRRIFAALLTVGSLNMVVMLAASLRELVVANRFGTGDSLDAFLIAYLLPFTAVSVIAGSMNAALIPTYIQVRDSEGKDSAQKLLSSVLVWSCFLLLIVSLLMWAASPYLLPHIASGFDSAKLELTRSLFSLLLPLLILNGIFITWSAALNADGRLALVSITPALTPIIGIAMILTLGGRLGIYSYALAMIVGIITEGIVLGIALRRRGIQILPRWLGISPAFRQVTGQYWPMIAGALIMSGTLLVDQAMAARLGSGSVSVLGYGRKLSGLIITLSATAVSAAALPEFSKLVAAGQWQSIRHTMRTYTPLMLIVTLPITAVFILFSQPLVRLLFERGAFTASDTEQVALTQSLFLLQVPFYILGMFFVRLITALRATRILLLGTTISLVLKVALNYFLMERYGVAGIALSTSLVYAVALGFLSFMALRLLKDRESEKCYEV